MNHGNARLLLDTRASGVHVARLGQPGLADLLTDEMALADLFQRFRAGPLARLGPGETLVLHLGGVKAFGTSFYAFLLKVRKAVLARQGHLILCHVGPELLDVFKLFQAFRLFPVAPTEAEAVSVAVAHGQAG